MARLTLMLVLLLPTAALAQTPWTVTVTPPQNPLAIPFCGAVQLTVFDPSTRGVPRNPQGFRVSIADFDMTVTGASVAGRWNGASSFDVCACTGGTVGTQATITASYPARALAPLARVPGVEPFQTTATFTIGAPKGTVNPPACVAAGVAPAAPAAATPQDAAPASAPAAGTLTPLPPGSTATPRVPASAPTPAAPPVGVALPPTAPPVTLAPATPSTPPGAAAPAPATPPAGTALPPSAVPPGRVATPAMPAPSTPPAVALPTPTTAPGRASIAPTPTPPAPATSTAIVPINPTGFTAVETGPGQVQLSWQPVVGASYYVLLGPGLPQGGVRVNGVTAYTASAVPAGSQQWAVASYYDPGPISTPAAAFPRVNLNVRPIPTNPTGFAAVQIGPSQVQLSWQPVSGASFYGVFGPGLPLGGVKVTGATTITATNVPAGSREWAVASLYDPGPLSTATAVFPRATLTMTAPATAPSAGRYLVTVTGLRAYQASQDDPLSRDGRGDEVYAAAAVRRYDRRTGQLAESTIRQTASYGDVASFAQRVQAGTGSGTGGIQDGDPIPAGPMVASRTLPAQDTLFPWRLWEGTLTDGAEALVITPSIWEQDGGYTPTNFEAWRGDGTGFYLQWKQQQQALDPSLFTNQAVQQQITQRTFGTLITGAAGVNGNSGLGINLRNFTDLTLLSFGIPVANLLAGSADRAIGILPNVTGPNADQTMLPIQAVVLTREIIEAALAQPPLGSIPSPIALDVGLLSTNAMATIGQAAPKPGVLVLHFQDGLLPNILGVARPAIYQMFLQVERLAMLDAPAAPATSAVPGATLQEVAAMLEAWRQQQQSIGGLNR